MRHDDGTMAGLAEHMMRTANPVEPPARPFELANQVSAPHSAHYTHSGPVVPSAAVPPPDPTNSPSSFVFTPGVAGEQDPRRDRELLKRLAAGRSEALGDLYDRHAGALFRHAFTLTGRRHDAEDLVHAVFVKLATTGAELLGVRAPVSYLHRMVRTTWIDGQRKRVTGARLADEVAHNAASWLDRPNGASENAIDLARAVEALAPLQREAIVLHVVEGLSFREIGRLTGVSLFTAAGRYRTAIGRLRATLGERDKPL